MGYRNIKFVRFLFCVVAISFPVCLRSNVDTPQNTYERTLETKIPFFDSAGRTLIENVLDLAYQYELPLGLEYLDQTAVTRAINLKLQDASVRSVLIELIQQNPQYQVSFSNGLVDIYSPKAREDSSNLFNRVMKDFTVANVDTHRADAELFCQLARNLSPNAGCGGSVAIGQWGSLKVNIDRHNAKIYEILNEIVAQNGKAVWSVMVPPTKMSAIPFGGLWHIYPLQPPFKDDLLSHLAKVGAETTSLHQSHAGNIARL